ncbi:MAG: DUF116 domain-containing protein [Candidatus Mcinerneyibacterium aminivorans]|uniref:DUF116 domain-containing protein n=1 Tax=Candidatus Mcinerneyibacterium aminivorans TaxID=2703815 RepID=A0A5D0MGG3_9BACT|nr:MAG: DUF116 domain-containing protein [Candidatus Mcinerneyibacterium aminivorans]
MNKKTLTISLLIYFLFLSFVYYLIYPRIDNVFVVKTAIIIIFASLYFVYLMGVVFHITGFAMKKLYFYPIYKYYVFPLGSFITGLFIRDKNDKWGRFIEFNNKVVKNQDLNIDNEDMLMLLPHCLQNSKCKIRITTNIDNCEKCGLCEIGTLKEIAENYKIDTFVVTGGTLARRFVKKNKPKGIVAVACRHDLKEGIELVYPIPVYGILNRQPEGPCINTQVDTEQIEYALENVFKIQRRN